MKAVNTWYPDTCKCILEVELDDTQVAPPGLAGLTKVTFLRKCPAHTNSAETDIVTESRFRQEVFGNVRTELALEVNELLDKAEFSYDENRTLNIFLDKTIPATNIQNKMDADYGPGKVKVSQKPLVAKEI